MVIDWVLMEFWFLGQCRPFIARAKVKLAQKVNERVFLCPNGGQKGSDGR
jgi:hypothetical protein